MLISSALLPENSTREYLRAYIEAVFMQSNTRHKYSYERLLAITLMELKCIE